VTLAEDLAEGIDALGGDAKGFIQEYLRAQTNPQRAARDVGKALSEQASLARVEWLILDDYHELAADAESERIVAELRERSRIRLLVASRVRPAWATSRGVLYGDEREISQAELAMTEAECRTLLGRSVQDNFVAQAQGWPAVLALAGALRDLVPHSGSMLPAKLHDYLAEELFTSADPTLQERLRALALLPNLDSQTLRRTFGVDADRLVSEARDLGFLSAGERVELHPLLREFLLSKIAETDEGVDLARSAVRACVEAAEWDQAVDLAARFELSDVMRFVLEAAYRPLVRSGRLGTLVRLGEAVRSQSRVGEPEVDLVDAEVALRNGEYRLAAQIVGRLHAGLRKGHELRARSFAIAGLSAFQLAEFEDSERAFEEALRAASDDTDSADALHGLVLAGVYGERDSADQRLAELGERARRSGAPIDVARHAACALARMRIGAGFVDSPFFDDAERVLKHVEDPRARTSVMVTLSYCLGLQARYIEAGEIARRMLEETDAFGLEFARPHGDWNLAFAALGLRRFAEADRALQRIEDGLARRHLAHHLLNARVLRARLLMQQGRPSEALDLVGQPVNDAAAPSMHAEYVAVRALALALLGDHRAARDTASLATSISISSEVAALAEGARAVIAARVGDESGAARLIQLARRSRVWDPVVTCLRSCAELATALTANPQVRPDLEWLYNQTNDYGLARRGNIRTRNVREPSQVLSPREREVLELMAQGYRNHEIASAFVISESTVKVHVRHVLEKLGVRTRTEAVARFRSLES